MSVPALSVVVPTRNRVESVLRLLRALESQEPVLGGFEVVVVADGCSDRTDARIQVVPWKFDLHVLDLPPSGPAIARNCGAALARAPIVLFLDDDVEPAPRTLRAHAELHQSGERRVGLGYLPPVPSGSGFFAAALRGWWESMFDGPRRPGYRYSFKNLLSGHFSMHLSDFELLGGFETSLTCHEDWEFGYRAIGAGLQFTFLPAAVAWHHDATDLTKALRRKFDEGVADVHLARLHPELVRELPIGWTIAHGGQQSRIVKLAWHHPFTGDSLFAALLRLLPTYERWRLRFRWRALLERAMKYWYWRGVAHAIGTEEALLSLVSAERPLPEPEFAVDVADGVDAACVRLDDDRPRGVHVMYRGQLVGDIPDRSGSEPLRGIHLRAALAGDLSFFLAQALAADHELPDPVAALLRAQAAAAENAGAPEAFAA